MEYLWWSQGALDEARARDEGMNTAAREVRDVLEGFARLNQTLRQKDLVKILANIFLGNET